MIYSSKEAFDLYLYYLAIKRHFTTKSYDYFKYNGKVKAQQDSFERRKDKYSFFKISKKPDPKGLVFANVLENPKIWIGDIANLDKCNEIYTDWKKRNSSLSYTFRNDLSQFDNLKDALKVKNGQHPDFLRGYYSNKVSLETLAILYKISNIFAYWEANIDDSIMFPDINTMVGKYSPFLTYKTDIMNKVLKEKYDENI